MINNKKEEDIFSLGSKSEKHESKGNLKVGNIKEDIISLGAETPKAPA